MQTMKTVHVMHRLPAMSAGLAALLQSDVWQVTTHADQPHRLPLADVVVTDYDDGVALAAADGNAAAVLVVTDRDREWEVRRALEGAVRGYVLEDVTGARLRHAVATLLAGGSFLCPAAAARVSESLRQEALTNREGDVLRLLAQGLCNKRIARDLGIGVGTVKTHVRGLMVKLGATARTHAVVVAAQRGLIGLEGARL